MENLEFQKSEEQPPEYLKLDDFLELNPKFHFRGEEESLRKMLGIYHFTPEILQSIVREIPYGVALHGTNYETALKIKENGFKKGNFISIPKKEQQHLDDVRKGKALLLNLFDAFPVIVGEGIDCQPHRFTGQEDLIARKYGDIPKDPKNFPAVIILKGRKDIQFISHDSSAGSPERSPYQFHYFVPKGGFPPDICDAIICPTEEEIKEIEQILLSKFGGGFELLDYELNDHESEINRKALYEYERIIGEILLKKTIEYFMQNQIEK